ncbi:MAG: glyoxylate/hydroxypyruvate reductase A [Rhodospirillaceae bacterium]|nr:glyoxylate/hydroxypyruvate reductase A [Rhodospirillaceae bacterium]|tara:strand:+ start:1757 stop:2689 length:933 start_codon:yes stop_codon:yes gene_type:complete
MAAVLFYSPNDSPEEWERGLRNLIPDLDFRAWPDIGNPLDIEFALVWDFPPGNYKKLKKLRCICSLGQGVDHIFKEPNLPDGAEIMRLVDPWMAQAMSEWMLLNVLRFHRQGLEYEELEKQGKWHVLPPPETSECRVGILGLGELGRDTAKKFASLGFDVAGWSKSPKKLKNVKSFHGDSQLIDFLNRTNILCCLLPLTSETNGIINTQTITQLPFGAYIINAGRGQHVVDECLLKALETGHIAGAALDVFNQEPLPPEHPYWAHPKVKVWPHVSAQSNAHSAANQVADAIKKVFAGHSPKNLVRRDRQY